ncbi:MAG: 16S rRNA processing protein RimM [Deinococcus sp.]|nr:16S rRNA processing protein RimM [Deinococcus sp.]
MTSKPRVIIGHIAGVFGTQGELKVIPLSDNPDRFPNLRRVEVEGLGEYAVESIRQGPKTLLLKLLGIDATGAGRFPGRNLTISADDVPLLPPGQYYHFQIIDLPAYWADGTYLGQVVDIQEAGASPLLVIGEARRLVPFRFATVEADRVVVELVEGLME